MGLGLTKGVIYEARLDYDCDMETVYRVEGSGGLIEGYKGLF